MAQRLLWVGIAFTIPHPRRAGKSFLRRPAKRAEIPLHPSKNVVKYIEMSEHICGWRCGRTGLCGSRECLHRRGHALALQSMCDNWL